ncbi:hypothetical protein C8Q80DRAFT_1119033 [Daedaleopsis nitida]|nr:hypothetical protein C8Q80DRAFT_1119033 [Daedaleopsis nitida]
MSCIRVHILKQHQTPRPEVELGGTRLTTALPLQLFSERILEIELITGPILAALSPSALLRLSRTCRAAYAAAAFYTRTAYNIDRLLSRFFPSSLLTHDHLHARARAFRSLQARTGTLISGSVALQFFDRAVWHESDLDLYVHLRHRREVGLWLLQEGYQFKPTDFQDPRFEVEVAECVARRPNGIYSMPGVMAILTFVKPLPRTRAARARPVDAADDAEAVDAGDQAPAELKVQVIVAKNTPMEVVLGFHSTCVMNVISYEKAYCLFPQATLEERRTLISSSCRGKGKHRLEGLLKYQQRGFRVVYSLPPAEVVPDPSTPLHPTFHRARAYSAESDALAADPTAFDLTRAPSAHTTTTKPAFRIGWRWIDDASSWVLSLPQTGVAPPPAPNGSTPPLTHDPVAVCNWEVRYHPARGAVMNFEVAAGKVLRYRYLVTDELLLEYLAKALIARMRLEEAKARLELEEWTYYDEELPSLCRGFLHDLASRRLSSLRI